MGDIRDQIIAFKRKLAPNREGLKRAYTSVKDHVSRAADRILREVSAGRPVVPELDYRDIREDKVQETVRQSIRSTGCAVIHGVFPAALASDWFAEVGEYLETNRYEEREVEKRSLDKYFSALKAGTPQIFNVYWSKPQVMARQDVSTRRDACFSRSPVEIRRRFQSRPTVHICRPGAAEAARGQNAWPFPPHGRRHRRALDRPGYQKLYARIFAGDWRGYDPFDATHRLETHEIPCWRCAACSAPIRAGRR